MDKAVAKSISTPPFLLQVAKDGDWEHAWSFEPLKGVSNAELVNYLGQSSFKTVAVETFFKNSNGEIYVLGLDYNDHLLIDGELSFIKAVIRESAEYENFSSYIQKLDDKLVGQHYLMTGDPDLIRIGIVNYWFSIGPCLIWQKGWSKVITKGLLDERLKVKPEIVSTRLNYQGMSFVFNTEDRSPGLCHWMKSPCAKFNDGVWTLDQDMILDYLHNWQEFVISE